MKSKSFAETRAHFLVFDRGDEVIGTLRRFAVEGHVRAGRFAAVGALERAVVAYWNREKLDYEKIRVDEQVEVLALLGDLAVEGERTKVHAHIVLGRRDGSTVGGHLMEGSVFPTLEMHLLEYRGELRRQKDEATRLSLIMIEARRGS